MKKKRLDLLLLEKNLFPTRQKAIQSILAGLVLVNNQTISKAGYLIHPSSSIRIKPTPTYISRGGIKLEKALKNFNISVTHQNILDVGASTGGFTHCLLKHHARLVYSLDVGHHQLHYSLQNHPQVFPLEKQNAKYLTPQLFNHTLHMAVIDVSFISLTQILTPVSQVLKSKNILALIKPQFEISQNIPRFNGVVHHPKYHIQALNYVYHFSQKLGLELQALTYSPITGPKGNIEFFMYWKNSPNPKPISFPQIVQKAHQYLKTPNTSF